MTSRRSDVVGTPASIRFRPELTDWPIAGPTTDIDAEPISVPLPLSMRNWSSPLVELPARHPFGADCPEGSTAAEEEPDGEAGFGFTFLARAGPFALRRLASQIRRAH